MNNLLGAHHSMSIPEVYYTWLPLWNTLCLITSSGTIALAHLAGLKRETEQLLNYGWWQLYL